MASMEQKKPSIEFIHSFYSGERKLFSRMASSLEIDGDLAFKIISYWLWLEENINKDVIHYIQSLTDEGLQRISSLGEQVLTNAGKSDSSIAHKALSGVDYFLKAVCYQAIDDLKDKAEYEKAKKALEELDLQEYLCKPDPSLVKSYSHSGYGAGSSSSAGIGMQPRSNNGFLSSIPESSASKISKSQTGSHGGGENREVESLLHLHNDCAQNSSQLSATAKAYIPNKTSHATSLPMVIPANNFPAPVAENKESSAIVPYTCAFSTQSGAIVPHLPAFPQQNGATVSHLPGLVPQTGAIMSHITAFHPQNGTVISHMPALVPHNGVFVQYMATFAPKNGSALTHIPAIAPQGSVVLHMPGVAPQNSVIVQHIPAFSPQSGAIGAHMPLISPQNGAIVPSQNGTSVFQSAPGATDMIVNAQNVPQPGAVILPPRRLHPDERTLFVTFSNGSPLTEDELFKFFQVRYEINAESIYIEEPNSTRPPQYAHVTFFNPEHVEYILKGQATVKFRSNGKHLWARRFIPRRRRRWGRNAN